MRPPTARTVLGVILDSILRGKYNWSLFEIGIAFTKDGGKDKKLSWIKDLNKIRYTTHHVEK